MIVELRYTRLKMMYPDLRWEDIQRLRERLGSEDRQLVETLLESLETIWMELERERILSKKNQIIQLVSTQSTFHEILQGDHTNCSCPVCVPEKYAVRA